MKDYTNYDYEALVQRMTDLLQDKEGWGDAYQSSTGQTLIQLMADVTDGLHYMLERRTLESFLNTARLRSSVIARASDLGYRPLRIRSHSGFLNVSLVDGDGNPVMPTGEVNIPSLTPITYADRNFYVVEPAFISSTESSTTIRIKEGTVQTDTFDLDAGEEVIFPVYEGIEEDVFFVFNNGVEYGDVRKVGDVNKRALSFLGPDDTYYDVKYGVEGMRVVFGDDEFGKKPTGVITVQRINVAELGDPIYALDSEFEFVDALTDFQFPDIEYISVVKNTSAIVGGTTMESNDSIKANASAYHRSNGRAVTNEDYSFWLAQSGIGDIVDARAYGEEEFDSLIFNANNVYLTYATSTGDALTTDEKSSIIEYFDHVKTSQAHIVLNQANNIFLQLSADVVRNKNVPISIAQAYSLVLNFIKEYMQIDSDSIGGFFHLSDLVNAMYGIKFNKNGIDYPLIDYVKLNSDVVIPFDYPSKTNEAFVEIDTTYEVNDGDTFILNLENMVCMTTVEAGDNFRDILTRMRDVIREVTPYDAVVQLSGVALDAFGNPTPIEINPKVGYHLLIGEDTPYISNDSLVKPAVIGSSVVAVATASEELEINHFYYSSRAGRRPMIPCRIGTEINFTAPTDTAVRVYKRVNAVDASSETLLTTIAAGGSYSVTSDETTHTIQFDYLADSTQDVIANIIYPDYVGVKYGIRIRASDYFGRFSVNTTSGDLAEYITVDYRIQLPIGDYYDSNTASSTAVFAGSLRITDTVGNVIYREDGSTGKFLTPDGSVVSSGSIDYKSGIITLPKTLPATSPVGKYQLMYDQDRFENLRVSSSDIIKLIEPPPTSTSAAFSLSTLKVS